jgi:lipooligosaccharide transport system permease protein
MAAPINAPATARPAPAATGRGRAVQPWGFAVREFRYWLTNYRRTWRGSVISSVLGPVLYLSAMGAGLGTLVNRHSSASLGGVTYLAFISPGLLAATAMQTGFGEGMYPVLGSVKWIQNYFAAAAGPLRPADVFRGHLMFVTLRLFMTCGIFLAVIAAFGAVSSPLVILTLPAAVLTGLAFAPGLMAWSVTRTTDVSFAVLMRFVMVPLFLFSGTFFPISQLPGWLQPVAYVTPLWHGVALCRSLALGQADLGSTAVHVGYLLVLALAGCVAAQRTYTKRLYE